MGRADHRRFSGVYLSSNMHQSTGDAIIETPEIQLLPQLK